MTIQCPAYSWTAKIRTREAIASVRGPPRPSDPSIASDAIASDTAASDTVASGRLSPPRSRGMRSFNVQCAAFPARECCVEMLSTAGSDGVRGSAAQPRNAVSSVKPFNIKCAAFLRDPPRPRRVSGYARIARVFLRGLDGGRVSGAQQLLRDGVAPVRPVGVKGVRI